MQGIDQQTAYFPAIPGQNEDMWQQHQPPQDHSAQHTQQLINYGVEVPIAQFLAVAIPDISGQQQATLPPHDISAPVPLLLPGSLFSSRRLFGKSTRGIFVSNFVDTRHCLFSEFVGPVGFIEVLGHNNNLCRLFFNFNDMNV